MSFCGQCGQPASATGSFCAHCGAATAPVETPAFAAAGADAPVRPLPRTQVPVPPPSVPAPQPSASMQPLAPSQTQSERWFTAAPASAAIPVEALPPVAPRKPLRIGALSPAQTSAALKDGAYALGAVLAVFTVVIAVLASTAADSVSAQGGSPVDWFRGALLALSWAVHAPVALVVSGTFGGGDSESSVGGQVSFAATATPLLLTLVVALAGYVFGRRSERAAASGGVRLLVTAAAATGASFAVLAAVLAAVAAGAPGFGADSSLADGHLTAKLSASSLLLLPGALLVVTAGAVLGRAAAAGQAAGGLTGRRWLGAQLGGWRSDVRHALTLLVGALLVAVGAALAFGAYELLHAAVTSSSSVPGSSEVSGATSGGPGAGTYVIGALLTLPNLLLGLTGAAMGATLGTSGGAGGQSSSGGSFGGVLNHGVGLLSGGVPTSVYLVVLPMLVMAVAVGARITYAREGEPARGPQVWRPMVLFAAGWLVLGVLLRLSFTVSGSASALSLFSGDAQGHAGAGLGLPSLVTVALLWALASAAAGPAAARFLASAAPGAAVKLGGRATSGEWRLLLADSVLVRGAKMPPALAAAETALRSGARPRVAPLGQHSVRDRAVLAGAVTLVGLVLVGTVGYRIVADTVYGPDRAVSNYFSALQAGNADRALAMVDSQDLKGLDRSLLTSAALRGAHVPDIKVGDVQRHGSSASVQVTEGGDSFSMDLVQQGKANGVFPVWRLRDPFTTLQIATGTSAVPATVNGVSVSSPSVPAFPGTYTVALPPSGALGAASSQVTASGSGSQQVALTPTLSPQATEAANDAVRSYLDSCASSTEASPPSCPFSYSGGSTLTSVHWSITNYPTVSASLDSTGSITVSGDGSTGTAHLDAVDTSYDGTSSPVASDESVTVSGTLQWTGGDPHTATFTSAP